MTEQAAEPTGSMDQETASTRLEGSSDGMSPTTSSGTGTQIANLSVLASRAIEALERATVRGKALDETGRMAVYALDRVTEVGTELIALGRTAARGSIPDLEAGHGAHAGDGDDDDLDEYSDDDDGTDDAELSEDPDEPEHSENLEQGQPSQEERRSEATPSKGTNGGKDKGELGRKLAEKILLPMGLWVKSRKLIADENLANGFPRVTSFIASDEDGLTSIYRRFDKLNIRNLLLLEAKVAALEALQAAYDEEDVANLKTDDGHYNFAMRTTHSSFEYFALLGEGKEVIAADGPKVVGTLQGDGEEIAQTSSGNDGNRVFETRPQRIKRVSSDKTHGKEKVAQSPGEYSREMRNASSSKPTTTLEDVSKPEGRRGNRGENIGKSGIPECAFREWDKRRERAAAFTKGKFSTEIDALSLPDNRKQSLIDAITEDHIRYWRDRWEISQAIQYALKEYQQAVILNNKMLKLQCPTDTTKEALKRYVGGTTYEDGKRTYVDNKSKEERNLRPEQFFRDSAAGKMITNHEDFVSLHPPGDDDLGTLLVAKNEGIKIQEFDDVSEIAVGRFTTIWTFFVAIGFLMGAVWFIWRVGLEEVKVEVKFERKLAILTAFTGLFGGWVALFTSAKRYEIFGATAAYAAVLIVFVGVDPGDAIGP